PALDPARRPARAAARRVSARAAARARAVPVPHLRRDRVHAEPARPRPDSPAAPRRCRRGGGLGGLWGGVHRRGSAVAVLSVVFATAFIALLVAVGTVVVSEARSAGDRVDAYFSEDSAATGKTGAEAAGAGLQLRV